MINQQDDFRSPSDTTDEVIKPFVDGWNLRLASQISLNTFNQPNPKLQAI